MFTVQAGPGASVADREDAQRTTSQRSSAQRITSQQVKAMREVKKASLVDHLFRLASSVWTAIGTTIGWVFAAKQYKKSFCELNGHSLLMQNGTPTNRCRYCETEISSVDMLTSR